MSEEERKMIEQNVVFKDTLIEITPELMKKTIIEQNDEIERLSNIISELGDRIDHAIRYINKCKDYHKTYHKEEKMYPDELTSLVMVLKGTWND